ncbi:hypothetical protein CPB86DRAFT_793754 [Serendipita vermifera]|nr:hypothetical protein CPB86DRAFT_793754 [Serendipita vermifera]
MNPTFDQEARYEQASLYPDGSSIGYTISHDHTTAPSESRYSSQSGRGVNSVYSYNSDRDVKRFVKEVHGRIFNNLNDAYLLPSDESEWGRLDKQNLAILIGMDGLYPCPEVVESVLAPEDGVTRRIADIGCGTGSWAIEMARRFPHASVLGIDLAPPPVDAGEIPSNVQFEIDDVNFGLSHFYDQFDLIHTRCISAGINDMDKTMRELQLCLKPGGLLLIVDGDINFRETRDRLIPLAKLPEDGDVDSVSEDGSWTRRIVWEACQACIIAGACLERSKEIVEGGFFDHPLMDPETAACGGVMLPVGPWAKGSSVTETQMLQYAGILMRQNLLNIHRAYHPILVRHGMDPAVLEEWSLKADEEIKNSRVKMWVQYFFSWARRRAGDDLPAPPLPTTSHSRQSSDQRPSTPTASSPRFVTGGWISPPEHRYPAIEIYRTKEEARFEQRRRQKMVGQLPPSALQRAWQQMQAQAGGST